MANTILRFFKGTLFVFLFVLSSCGFFGHASLIDASMNTMNPIVDKLCEAINNNDAAAIKRSFSSFAIEEDENFDESVLRLLDYIDEDIFDNDRGYIKGESSTSGDTQPNEKIYSRCRYNFNTMSTNYKVLFSYYAYYSDEKNVPNEDKMGFYHFSIIDERDDREGVYSDYTGHPEERPGINIGFITEYSEEEYNIEYAYYDEGTNLEPIVFNSISDVDEFYNTYKSTWSLDFRLDTYGFRNVVAHYDPAFFQRKSLILFGRYFEDRRYDLYMYARLYIGDFVYFDFYDYLYEGELVHAGIGTQFKGTFAIIETPIKIDSNIEIRYTNR